MGVFILASTLSPLALVADLGISQATTHAIASRASHPNGDDAPVAVTTSVAFYLVAGVIAAVALWLAAPWLTDILTGDTEYGSALWAFRIGALHLVAAFLLQPVLAIYKGVQRFELVAVLASTVTALSLGGAIILMALRADLVNVMAGFAVGHATAVALGYTRLPAVLRAANVPVRRARPSWAAFRELSRFGWPLMVGSIASVLMYHPQRLVIGATVGPYGVTVYQLAAVIPSRVQALVATATEALFPYASASPGHKRLRRAYVALLLGGALVSFTLLLILVLGGVWIMNAWLGGKVAVDVARLLPVTSAAYFLITLSAAPYYLGIGLGRPHLVASIYVAAGALNLAVLLAMLFGGVTLLGVAFAFLVVNALACVGYQLLTERVLWREVRR